MTIQKLYPDLQEFYNKAGLIYPQNISNGESVSPIAKEDPTFENRKVDTAKDTPKQTGQNSDNSLNNIDKLVQSRKAEITNLQDIRTLKHKNNNVLLLLLSFAIAVFYIASAINPLFAIGLAITVTAAVILLRKNHISKTDYDSYCTQKMCIDMLLKGIKNNIPDNDISLEENTNLLNILDNAVNSVDNKGLDLINKMRWYYNNKNRLLYPDTTKQRVKNQIKDFSNLVFKNAELTDHLEKLGFNVDVIQDGICTHIENSTIDQMYETILGTYKFLSY